MVLVRLAFPQAGELSVTLVGNAGVQVSDGVTSLLIDLPYESGAFGYQTYDPAALAASGDVVAVVTHHHRDHFDAGLFGRRQGWRVVGPPSATTDVAADRVVRGDSVRVGAFDVIAIPTPHTDDHRSYRIRWRGRVLHFVGDTEEPRHLAASPRLDVLFITPWLSCMAEEAGVALPAARSIAYHLRASGGDRVCGGVETLPQGSAFVLPPA